jgi:hypothetical protein
MSKAAYDSIVAVPEKRVGGVGEWRRGNRCVRRRREHARILSLKRAGVSSRLFRHRRGECCGKWCAGEGWRGKKRTEVGREGRNRLREVFGRARKHARLL